MCGKLCYNTSVSVLNHRAPTADVQSTKLYTLMRKSQSRPSVLRGSFGKVRKSNQYSDVNRLNTLTLTVSIL